MNKNLSKMITLSKFSSYHQGECIRVRRSFTEMAVGGVVNLYASRRPNPESPPS
jgi:hypothetical protein